MPKIVGSIYIKIHPVWDRILLLTLLIKYPLILPTDSSFGQPFNQLATLSSGQGHGIISVYYYLRW